MRKFKIRGRVDHAKFYEPMRAVGMSESYGCLLHSLSGFEGSGEDREVIERMTRDYQGQDRQMYSGISFKSKIPPVVLGVPETVIQRCSTVNLSPDIWLNSLDAEVVGYVYEVERPGNTKPNRLQVLGIAAVWIMDHVLVPSDHDLYYISCSDDIAVARHEWVRGNQGAFE